MQRAPDGLYGNAAALGSAAELPLLLPSSGPHAMPSCHALREKACPEQPGCSAALTALLRASCACGNSTFRCNELC